MGFFLKLFKKRRERQMMQAIDQVLTTSPDADAYRNAGMPEHLIKDQLEFDRQLKEHRERELQDPEYRRWLKDVRRQARERGL